MLNKTGIVFFITLMFIAGIIVPVVSAVQKNSSGENPTSGITTLPMISFDGLSEPSSAQYNATELKIPSSITKYELLTFEITKMREKLAKNETITVRINGVPYKINVHDSTGKAIGLDPSVRSYYGSLENVNDSKILLVIGQRVITGEILINDEKYHLGSTPKNETGKVIQYLYSSKDQISVGQPTFWADDYLAHKNPTPILPSVSVTMQSSVTTQHASLPPIIVLSALGLMVLGILIRR